MHAKYVVLQFSYSAPVCVSVVAARATTLLILLFRVVARLFVAGVFVTRAETDFDVCCCVLGVIVFCEITDRAVFRGVDALVRVCCVVVPLRRLVLDTGVVRDAAKSLAVNNVHKTKINPILFISDINVSKFSFYWASK